MITLVVDILTIIGFLVTCWVAISISRLRRQFLFKGRHSGIKRDIRKYSSELSQLLDSNSLDGSVSEIALRRCQSSLKTLRRFIPGDYLKPVKEAESSIKICIKKKKTSDRNSIRDIYHKLITVESDLENIKKDEKWSLTR